MSVRTTSRSTALAIALTASVTAGASMLLTACGPTGDDASASTSAPPAQGGGKPSASATTGSGGSGGGKGGGGAKPVAGKSPVVPVLNGTAHNGLTISNGTRWVVMNGTRVDFGTAVRDLAWTPDGRKAAFIDGDGDLAVSNPDGSGRVVAAKNPGGQNWSHPTWEMRAAMPDNGIPALNNIVYAVREDGVSRLVRVSATAHNGTSELLGIDAPIDSGPKPLPQTGNVWPNGGGRFGAVVYSNPAADELYIRDDVIRQQTSPLTTGTQPDMSPTDNGEVVFVRSVGGHDHLFLEKPGNTGATYKDLTPNATTDYTEPAFSPDARTIAARTPAGIVTLPADGSHAPVRTSGYVGLPAYRG